MPTGGPLISVVIPACNAAAHLRTTLNSVLAQTWRHFEVLVVDDGSTDHTVEIVREFQAGDPRIHLIRQPNRGVGAARNTGIRAARGAFIAPLDADDLWAPRKLELQLKRLERAGTSTALAYCWSQSIDQAGRLLAWGHPTKLEGRVGSAMLLGNFVGNASAPLIRRSALATVGFYLTRAYQNGAQGCEDWDLHMRLAERFSVCCVPAYLVSYRQGCANMSLNAATMTASYHVVLHRALLRNAHLTPQFRSWSNGRFYSYLMNRCYIWSDYASTLRCLGHALLADPAAWLNPRNYRIGTSAMFHLFTRGKFRRFRSPPPLAASTTMPCPSPSSVAPAANLFARIEQRRLARALRERTSFKSPRSGPRQLFAW